MSTMRWTASSWVNVLASPTSCRTTVSPISSSASAKSRSFQTTRLYSSPPHERNGSFEHLQRVDLVDGRHRAVGELHAQCTGALRQGVPTVERDHGQDHQVSHRKSVMAPCLVERVVHDTACAQACEVFANQRLVVTTAHLGR